MSHDNEIPKDGSTTDLFFGPEVTRMRLCETMSAVGAGPTGYEVVMLMSVHRESATPVRHGEQGRQLRFEEDPELIGLVVPAADLAAMLPTLTKHVLDIMRKVESN